MDRCRNGGNIIIENVCVRSPSPRTCPVLVSNLYNRKPGLLGPPTVFGVTLGAIIIQDTGRPVQYRFAE